ncbi:hypothetical protein [Pseudonocardia cypriaca]|uniref:Uncharacterized protein n=1 Tax=Pseudonocardia cypriaca TaxID=882449 RepID=A0A543FVK9_9PSEU|nr:hypothetical protein [Pseudonocardia cypriaca]TQM37852.1 hypothetical protein FB388_5071 [Pseudonocardia cypriaca]
MPRRSAPPQSLSRYWNKYVGHCAGSVGRFRRITYALPAGPARTWLGEIAQRLDVELDAVRRLAIVGDSIEPAWFRVSEAPAKRIAKRLEAARTAFEDAVSQAAEVAEQVALDPAHSDVRAHLEVLSRQASQLALAPAPPDPEPEPTRRRRIRRREG